MAADQIAALARRALQTAPSNVVPAAHEMVVASGISPRLWRLYAQAWLVCLLFPILTLIQQRPPVLPLLLAVAGLAIFVACYTAIMWSHPLRPAAHRRWSLGAVLALLLGLVALVLALSLAYGSTFLWLLVGVSAMAGVLLSPRGAFLAVMALTLLTLGCAVGIAGGLNAADWLHVVPLVLLVRGLGLDMAGLARLASALREVHAARGELARMAVIEERLRMARDLHDLLGHTLAMVTLKSELAQRLVSQDPARAAQEMRDVEQAARQTLREVRVVVAGAQQPTLQAELEGARQLLEAAGIAYTIEQTAEALPESVDAVLAWTIREGVTNVIRHSRASWCRVRVLASDGRVSAEITNNAAQPREPKRASGSTSTGLAGLTGRVTAHAGQLMAESLDGGFRLWVE
ncbi:MAG TPA: histidine kinase, partial [Roseiflexaceae bacterium]|nr:histidine kinase [Roseiflexaceae bacterium]